MGDAMNNADLDLLQRVLDGEATPEEHASLESRMTADPALRERFDSMASLFLALDDEVLEPAPVGLRDDVLNALPAAPRREPRSMIRAPWSRLLLPLASAAAALALIVAAMRMVPSPLAPDGRTAGTMSGVMPQPVRLELPVEGKGFHVMASRDNKGIARLDMATDAPVHVSLSCGRGSVAFEGVATPPENGAAAARSGERLDWYLEPGVALRVHCTPGPSPVLVNVRVEAPSGASSEIGIRLKSLPTVHRP
jgi:hypothetical protein